MSSQDRQLITLKPQPAKAVPARKQFTVKMKHMFHLVAPPAGNTTKSAIRRLQLLESQT
jgi:hypothetical protein